MADKRFDRKGIEDIKMKLVSVIVQAYNSSDTIIRTLDSVKAQTYKNIELIVTDDKSKDNTVEVVSEWLDKNKTAFTNTILITTEINTGIPGNNNRALKQVHGEYAEFLAADDCLTPDAIYEYVNYCENNPDTIPISKVELFSDEECDYTSVQNYCEKCYEFAKQNRENQYRQILIQNRIVAPAASFYPVEILRKLNGFDEAYRWMEDYPINLKILKCGFKFGFLDKKLIYYRISGCSITGSGMTRLKKTEAKLFFREKMWYMIGNGMGLEAVKQLRYWIKIVIKKGD